MGLPRATNKIKPYPLTADTYINQWTLLTLTMWALTLGVTAEVTAMIQ